MDVFNRAISRLGQRYKVINPNLGSARTGYLSDSDESRRSLLQRLLLDPDVDFLVAVRGGYGSMRIIDWIDPEIVRRERKTLVGFSDITALHALWNRAKVKSLHAGMFQHLADSTNDEFDHWVTHLEMRPGVTFDELACVNPGTAQGHLIGGNLSIVSALAATPYSAPIDNAIIVFEDVDEAPYRIDRMLTSLRLAGWWKKAAGVVFGQFDACNHPRHGVPVEEVIREHFRDITIPVVYNLPVGHGQTNQPIWLGSKATLDANRKTLSLAPLSQK